MSQNNPQLQAALEQLDQELEEGDITEKGYQKRRTLILSQFLGPVEAEKVQRSLRVHSVEDSDHPASNDGSRSASLAALNANSSSASQAETPSHPSMTRQLTAVRSNEITGDQQSQSPGVYGHPQGHVQRFQERELNIPAGHQRSASGGSIDASWSQGNQDASRTGTLTSQNYAFNPTMQTEYYDAQSGTQTRQSTMLDSQQGYFSDFAGQQRDEPQEAYGGGPHRYSQPDAFSPTAGQAPPLLSSGDLPSMVHQLPLEPRDVPFAVHDPHDPSFQMSKFDNIAMVLRHRAKTNAKQPAYWVLDNKGKEIASITWDKLASRAEKVAQIIRDKSSLYRGDRVALIYRSSEVIEFAVAVMGCFIAGVVAVPINNLEDYQRLNVVLTSTQAHLALTTEYNLKNFQRDITNAKLQWPRGVEWWKTNEFGSYHPKRKDETPPLVVPDLAYIEFSRAPTGDLRGVVMSHRTVMHQMACMSAIITTASNHENGQAYQPPMRDKNDRLITGRHKGEIILSYLDPRQSIGMILGVLLAVYGGHTVVLIEPKAVETPGLYAHLITKYKATLLAADYPGLKNAAFNYQADPMTTRNFKKGQEPDFSTLKLCLIDTLTVDCEFDELLADRWLRPLRNPRSRDVVAPMLCLPEHGGMVISMRDWLGGEERMGVPLILDLDKDEPTTRKTEEVSKNDGFGSSLLGGKAKQGDTTKHSRYDLGEVLLDKEALKTNEVVVLALGEEAKAKANSYPNAVRVGAFGYPIPDATLAVVDPETCLLQSPNTIGEIWVDSPSLSGGFWALPKHTETIFHARPYRFQDSNPTPMAVDPEFLRTGLLGCTIEGKVYVLGLYEDRLRQKVEWVEHGLEIQEYRYFFVQHLILSIMKNVPKVHDCSAFDVFVNDEHLPIVLLESYAASTAPTTSGGPPRQLDIALLDSLSERCIEVLYHEHHLRVYCVMITAPNTLPRVIKHGRREIGNMLCRKEFDNGTLPCVHVKFGAERSVLNLPIGIDPVGGMWSPISSSARQEILMMQDKQYSGADFREVVMDDRTSTPLNNFSNIEDLLQFRVTRQADELAYCTIDSRGREGKGLTWKKFDQKVAAVAMYLKSKVKVKAGDHLILMYTHSEEFVFAVHACFCLGVVVIPVAPLDQNRLSEDAPAFLHCVADFRVRGILVNADVDHLLKQKLVSQHIKQSAQVLRIAMPSVYNTAKPSKQSHGCRDLGLTVKPEWALPNNPVLIWTYWTPDQRRISVQLGHDTIIGMCKVQKETCQMGSARPVLGCVRSTMGLGFVHTCLIGCYVGAPTYLVSPVDFATSPQSLFVTLSRYKIKDTYATTQMLDYTMSAMVAKGFSLHEMRNMMIAMEARPRTDIYQKVRLHFASAGLDRTAINTIYSHVLNPMITSRSYMSIEPIELWLDNRALRRGLVYPVDPDSDPSALLVQDSGMVPISTQIAIVNPETCQLCHIGEFGEIWVQSEACCKAFYGSKQDFDLERFNGRTVDGDPNSTYVRTGDLGFLHNVTRPIGAGGQPVEMQVLFVLGSIGETFEVNGLNHFPIDIEASIEKCHRNITPGGCAIFQAGGLVVVLVEVYRKAYLASIVPVIVNAILNEHQLVIDIVAFVSNGDFPRSRLGEKQRGKILASWVTRKLRTIAQFGIRDADGSDSQITEVPEPRSNTMMSKPMTQSLSYQPRSITGQAVGDTFNEGIVTSPDNFGSGYGEPGPSGLDSTSRMATPTVALNDQPYDSPQVTGSSNGPSAYQIHQLEDAPYTLDNESPPAQLEDTSVQREVIGPQGSFPKRTSSMRVTPKLSVTNPETFDPVSEVEEDNVVASAASASAPTFSSIPQSNSYGSLNANIIPRDLDSPYDSTGNPFIEATGEVPPQELPADTPSPEPFKPDIPVPEPLNLRRGSPDPDMEGRSTTPTGGRQSGFYGGRTTLPSQQARYSSYGSLSPVDGSTTAAGYGGMGTGGGLRVTNMAGDSSDEEQTPLTSPLKSPTPGPPSVNYQRKPSMTQNSIPLPQASSSQQQSSSRQPSTNIYRNIYEDEDEREDGLYEDYPREALLYASDSAGRERILHDRMGSTRRSGTGSDFPTRTGNKDGNDLSSVSGSVSRRSGSAEPVGGIARFQTAVNSYRHNEYAEDSNLVTFFSGDAYNPSLESSVTKGRHMVPFLNSIGTDVACVGNHDLDFGVEQFQHLGRQCSFPWLLANVLDPALGDGVPLGNCKKTHIIATSNGIKIGIIGLAEREWLATINALPPNLIYESASATAEKIVPSLRKEGCEIIIALTHMREPNDNKLADKTTPGLIDLILGGHDHYYSHSVINGTHVLRSGTDFRQLSYIEGWRKEGGGWDISITRQDITRSIPEDKPTLDLVSKLTDSLKRKLETPIGYTAAPLDARFTTVRTKESNIGNFVCDLMRFYYDGDCTLMAAGTIRGDQVYPPGVLRLKDIMNCFPFEDPVVVIQITGNDLKAALENSVSLVPALEGRYPQVSNIEFGYRPDLPVGSRVQWAKVGGKELQGGERLKLVTRGYMGRGKDGFDSLLVKSEGGTAEEIVSEENGVLISTILRQYFMSLKVMGQWNRWGTNLNKHWTHVNDNLHQQSQVTDPPKKERRPPKHGRTGSIKKTRRRGPDADIVDSDTDEEEIDHRQEDLSTTFTSRNHEDQDFAFHLAKLVAKKWMRLAHIKREATSVVDDANKEFNPSWTKGIAPKLEGRIQIITNGST